MNVSSFKTFSLAGALVALSNRSFDGIQILQNMEQCYPVPRNMTMKFTNEQVCRLYRMFLSRRHVMLLVLKNSYSRVVCLTEFLGEYYTILSIWHFLSHNLGCGGGVKCLI